MQVNLWHYLPAGPRVPDVVNVVVEVPKTSRNKYEYSKEVGSIELDRVLYSSLHFPGDYGFIPRTYYEDGDPLDILVMTNHPTFPGCIIQARPIGMFRMIDKGEPDFKILAVPADDPNFNEYWDVSNIPQHFPREMAHFFMTYKQLEGTEVTNNGWAGVTEAKDTILASMQHYQEQILPRVNQHRLISSGTQWEADYGYSRAVRMGDTIYVSGTTATDATGSIIAGDASAQTRQVLQNIAAALEKAGASLEDVVRTRIYVVTREDVPAVLAVHGEVFGTIRPATSLLLVAGLLEESMRVEIEAQAVVRL